MPGASDQERYLIGEAAWQEVLPKGALSVRQFVGSVHYSPIMKVAWGILLSLVLLAGSANLFWEARLLSGSAVYGIDILQDYLMGKAVLAGDNPYRPIEEMAVQYLGRRVGASYPSPHPPPVALLFLPLSLAPYPAVGMMWFYLEILMLCGSLHLLLRSHGHQVSLPLLVSATVMLSAWSPIQFELECGQLGALTLLLLALSYRMLSVGREGASGILLGLAVLVKFSVWPALLVYLFRRQWRLVLPSAGTIAAAYALAALVMGGDVLLQYVTKVLPSVNDLFGKSLMNVSLWGAGWRGGEGGSALYPLGVEVSPLAELGAMAPVVAGGLVALMLLLFCSRGVRYDDPRDVLAAAVPAGILVSPLAWTHMVILTVLPFVHIWFHKPARPSSPQAILALASLVVLAIPLRVNVSLALTLAGQASAGVRYLPGWVNLLPMICSGALVALWWTVDQLSSVQRDQAPGP